MNNLSWVYVAGVRQHELCDEEGVVQKHAKNIKFFKLFRNPNVQTNYLPFFPPGIKDTVSQEVKSVRFFSSRVQLPPASCRVCLTLGRFLYFLSISYNKTG